MKDHSFVLKDELTVKEALERFYKHYKIPLDGGATNSAVEIRLFKGLTLYMPNFEARKKLVLKHDVHHLITGYQAVMKGETEISTWELATGCFVNWFAVAINGYGMMLGVLFNLRGTWKAWLRGQGTTNLYQSNYSNGELLSKIVKDLKQELGFQKEQDYQPRVFLSFLSFAGVILLGIMLSWIPIALIPFMLIYSLFIFIRKLWRKS